MEKKKQEYHTSFFKPSNERTRANRNMVLWLVSIWAVAVFGFQILLKVIEKPIPEPAWQTYQSVKAELLADEPSEEVYRKFANVNLSVLAKVFIKTNERELLQKSMSWAFFKMAKQEQKEIFANEIKAFKAIEDTTTDVQNPVYQEAKLRLQAHAAPYLKLNEDDGRLRFLPLELRLDFPETLSQEQLAKVESIMSRYLIHNRSVLTDTIFLGFPFHYFYTAVILLVLFVFLCWLYCITADSQNRKHNIQD